MLQRDAFVTTIVIMLDVRNKARRSISHGTTLDFLQDVSEALVDISGVKRGGFQKRDAQTGGLGGAFVNGHATLRLEIGLVSY